MVWLIYFSSYGGLRLHSLPPLYWLLPDDDSAELWSTRVAKAEMITAYTSTTACAYAAGRQELHRAVNCLNLGVEKDREGCEIWKQNKKGDRLFRGGFGIPLVCRSATVGRDRRDAHSSPSAERKRKKKRWENWKVEKKRSWRDLNWNKTKTEIHEQYERYGRKDDEEKKDTQKKKQKNPWDCGRAIYVAVRPLFSVFFFLLFLFSLFSLI